MRTPHSVILLTLVSMVVIPGCSAMYRCSGVVVDGDGHPIAGVEILVYPVHNGKRSPSKHGGKTDANGEFDAHWSDAPNCEFFRLSAVKEGFEEDWRIVASDETNIRIVLSKKSTD